jgi:hypothetical protein
MISVRLVDLLSLLFDLVGLTDANSTKSMFYWSAAQFGGHHE